MLSVTESVLSGIPLQYRAQYQHAVLQLLQQLLLRPKVKLFAISGAQGCGKSTLAAVLVSMLQQHGLQVAAVSLDDYYLTKSQRQQLAHQVHPWLAQRGVPGTHDIARAIHDAEAVFSGQPVRLPSFSKALDDRLPDRPLQQLDLLIIEGWCLGCPAQSAAQLRNAVNQQEQQLDADGRWRHYVNQQLAGRYQQYFQLLQYLLYVKAPDWQAVCRWRQRQEQQLWRAQGQGMTDVQLANFMASFQRLTEHGWQQLPQLADICWPLDQQQRIQRISA